MVAGVGLEPTTFRVWTGCSSQLSYPAIFVLNGRDDRIWTCDPLIPNQVHYQAVLHPDKNGAPSRNRTRNLLIRSQTLYPVELWAHFITLYQRLLIISNTVQLCKPFFIFLSFFIWTHTDESYFYAIQVPTSDNFISKNFKFLCLINQ